MSHLTSSISIRVRYAETDNMGVAYHGSYFIWYEVGRTELIRELGYAYQEMESDGVFMPVIEAHAHYLKPARYDDALELKSELTELIGIRIRIKYNLYHENVLLATGYTVHAFMDRQGKPTRPPERLTEEIRKVIT